MLHVDYIDNFETKALDVLRGLSAEAERADIAVAFLSYRGWLELKPSLVGLVERGGRLRVIVRGDARQTSPEDATARPLITGLNEQERGESERMPNAFVATCRGRA